MRVTFIHMEHQTIKAKLGLVWNPQERDTQRSGVSVVGTNKRRTISKEESIAVFGWYEKTGLGFG